MCESLDSMRSDTCVVARTLLWNHGALWSRWCLASSMPSGSPCSMTRRSETGRRPRMARH